MFPFADKARGCDVGEMRMLGSGNVVARMIISLKTMHLRLLFFYLGNSTLGWTRRL